MTSVAAGSDQLIFHSKEAIVDHLARNIRANTKRQVGTEWEMFFVQTDFFTEADFFTQDTNFSFHRELGQKAFQEFFSVFGLMGYAPEFIYETDKAGMQKIIGIKIPTLGCIVPEAGYQFEFATTVSQDCDEIADKNHEAYRAILEVARRLNCVVVFKGHQPGFAEKSSGMDRSRGEQWRAYYASARFDQTKAGILNEAQNGTASVQVTIDAGADDFHEFFQALLLIEPALSLHYANSNRSYVGMRAYGRIIPTQVEPLVNVWGTLSPEAALTVIVERLLQIEVPFLPDPLQPGLYKAEPLINHQPPKVSDLMLQGRLSEKMLNNIGGFFYTRPALKNFAQGLLEVRGVDSQPTPELVTEITKRVTGLVYHDHARRQLLDDYAYLSPADVRKLHQVAIMAGREEATQIRIADFTMAAFVEDILARADAAAESTVGVVGDLNQDAILRRA